MSARAPKRGDVYPATASLSAVEAPDFSFDAVYRAHARTVLQWVARLGGPHLDPEDVTHDVFLKVEKELPNFRGDSRITTWLYAITVNQVQSARRREKFRALFRANSEQMYAVPDLAEGASETLERAETVRRLHRVLEGLSSKYRQVLVLFELEGRSGQEVAEMMQAPVERIWVWLHRARAAFSTAMSQVEAEEAAR